MSQESTVLRNPLAESEPAIRVQDLTFTYPDGPVALQRVSFEAAEGESIGLVGPNGAGKTTLFLCLSGVLSVKKGSVRLAGLDPTNGAQRRAIAAKAGIVFQNSDDQLFNATVFDDVAFGPLNLGCPALEVKQRVTEALARVGLIDFERRVPFHLSGGEKRRVALAGVLAMRPEILLLDEPSLHLDPRGRRELIRLIKSLTVTKIIAAHDLELVRETCQRVLVLDGGRLICDGPSRTVLADARLMEEHGLEVPHSLTHHVDQHHGD
jgi:cobalt/nickel transport system ATP-binding protein